MEKIMRIGKVKRRNIFIKAEFNDGRFSLSGVIGPLTNGDCVGGCGQVNVEFEHRNPQDNDERYQELIRPENITFAPGWDRERWFDLLDIWKRWHLNDMQAGCKHQREKWDIREKIELIEFTWSTKFHQLRERAENGALTEKEYGSFQLINAQVWRATIKAPVRWLSPLAKKLLNDEWIKITKTEKNAAGWVRENEHPKGLLMKACPDCGYQYGSKWLREEVPQEIIDKVVSFPDADYPPAWI